MTSVPAASLRLTSVVWLDDPDLDLTGPFPSRPSRAADGRVWWASTNRSRDGVALVRMSLDGTDTGSAIVASDYPLLPEAAASGRYVAVVSSTNIPESSVLRVYEWSADEPVLVGAVPLAFDAESAYGLVPQVVAGDRGGGVFYLPGRVDPADDEPGRRTLRRVRVVSGGLAVDRFRWDVPVGPDGEPLPVRGFDVCEPPVPGPAFLLYVVVGAGQVVRFRGPSTVDGTSTGAVDEVPLPADGSPDGLRAVTAWSVDRAGSVWLTTTDVPASLHVVDWPVGGPAGAAQSVRLPDYPGSSGTAGTVHVSGDELLIRRGGEPVELLRGYRVGAAAGGRTLTPSSPAALWARCDVLSVVLGDSVGRGSGCSSAASSARSVGWNRMRWSPS